MPNFDLMKFRGLLLVLLLFSFLNAEVNAQCPCTGGDEVQCAVNYLAAKGILDSPSANTTDKIIREDLAKIAFVGLYGSASAVTPADSFPTPFTDLQGSWIEYYKYAKALSYLEYQDGVSPFDRDFANFRPGAFIERAYTAKVFIETFNIPLTTNSTPYFTDVPDDFTVPEFYYIQTLAELGIITTSNSTFCPYDHTVRSEAFLMLYRILCLHFNNDPLALPAHTDGADYFVAANLTPENLNNKPGLSDANFDAYSKTSFYIPGRNLPLVFSHNYNSHLTELPEEFFPICPMGRGWSHSYNAYITKVDGYVENGFSMDDQYVVFWPGGSMYIFVLGNSNNVIAKTKGVYDDITFTSNVITIKKKNQMEYIFEKVTTDDDAAFMLKQVKDRNNNKISLDYGITTITSTPLPPNASCQNPTTNQLDKPLPYLTEVTGTAGRKLKFTYHPNFLLKQVEDPIQRKVLFEYDNLEMDLIKYTDAENYETEYSYDLTSGYDHLLSKIKLPKGNVIDNTYEDRKLTSTKTNQGAGGQQIKTDIDWGLNGSVTGGANSSVRIDDGSSVRNYDYQMNQFNQIKSLTTPTNDLDDVEYNDPTNPTLPTKVIVDGFETNYEYFAFNGNVKEVIQPLGITHKFTYTGKNDIDVYTNPRGFATDFNYDGIGNLKQIVTPIGTTNMDYNGFGQPTQITNPEGITVSFGYNSFGNQNMVTAPGGLISGATYDGVSRLVNSTNPNGQVTQYAYDNRDFITQTTDALSHVTQFRYDDNGNMIEIENAKNNITSLSYDDNDWLTSESFGGFAKNYVYDDEGKLVRMTKPDGTDLFYTYDGATGNLTSDDYAQFTYDVRNRLETVTRGLSIITYTYDDLNRIISIDHSGETISYEYDNNSNITKLIYPGGNAVTYTYDSKDRLETVTDWNNNQTLYSYLDDDRLNTVVYPNGVATEYEYDSAGRMTKFINYRFGAPWIRYVFSLDDLGNHLQENKLDQPYGLPTAPTENLMYSYNNINRIETMTGDMGTNLSWTFDANGNTLSKTGTTYTWDIHDMLLTYNNGTDSHSYDYDGLGNRRTATRNGQKTHYTLDILGMSRVLVENNGSAGNPENFYVYGLGLISRVKPNGDTNYYTYDFRGSTIAMTDASGTVTHSYSYDAWGKVTDMIEADENRFRYVGMYGVMYETNDLTYMRARYYDAEIGRFLSEDPIWSTNLYPYANNNPTNLSDYEGLSAVNAAAQFVLSGSGRWALFNIGYGGLKSGVKGTIKPMLATATSLAVTAAAKGAVIAGKVVSAKGMFFGMAVFGMPAVIEDIAQSHIPEYHFQTLTEAVMSTGEILRGARGMVYYAAEGIAGVIYNGMESIAVEIADMIIEKRETKFEIQSSRNRVVPPLKVTLPATLPGIGTSADQEEYRMLFGNQTN